MNRVPSLKKQTPGRTVSGAGDFEGGEQAVELAACSNSGKRLTVFGGIVRAQPAELLAFSFACSKLSSLFTDPICRAIASRPHWRLRISVTAAWSKLAQVGGGDVSQSPFWPKFLRLTRSLLRKPPADVRAVANIFWAAAKLQGSFAVFGAFVCVLSSSSLDGGCTHRLMHVETSQKRRWSCLCCRFGPVQLLGGGTAKNSLHTQTTPKKGNSPILGSLSVQEVVFVPGSQALGRFLSAGKVPCSRPSCSHVCSAASRRPRSK